MKEKAMLHYIDDRVSELKYMRNAEHLIFEAHSRLSRIEANPTIYTCKKLLDAAALIESDIAVHLSRLQDVIRGQLADIADREE